MLTYLPAVLCMACAGWIAAFGDRTRAGRAAAKTGASLAMVAQAIVCGAATHGLASQWVVAALVLSALGDIALLSRGTRRMLAGIVAFGLAHVCYIASFGTLGVSPAAAAAAGIPVVMLAFAAWQWLRPHAGRLVPAVLAYLVVIGVMSAMAAGAFAASRTPGRGALLLAALLFVASDVTVARDRFTGSHDLVHRTIGLPAYYAAQLIFAIAIVRA